MPVYVVWKLSAKSASVLRSVDLSRAAGYVIVQYYSSKADADAYVARQKDPSRYRVEVK